MVLAVATGVAPSVWIAEGHRVMETAFLILAEQEKAAKSKSGGRPSGGPQMSG